MKPTKNIIITAALSAALSVAHLAGAQGADGAQTMKPMQGVGFHAGTKHAVGYFLSESGSCKLVLTLAEDANFAPTRFEAAVEAGQSTRYQLVDDKSIQFTCQADGQAMKINSLQTFAKNG
jgi:hypothetical protein